MSTENTIGRVAVITGASSGIGEATARALAADGHRVALLARRLDRIRALADELGDGAVAIEADVTDRDSIVAASQCVQDDLGGADILVNNAGVIGRRIVVGAEVRERVVDVADCFQEQGGHLRDYLVRWGGHRLGFGDQVPRIAEDPIDAAREREQVLGLKRSDERGAQRAQEGPLGVVGAVLGFAYRLGGRRVAGGPSVKRIEALEGYGGLLAQ